MSTGLAIGISFVLLGLNAFFVAAEFALVAARRSEIESRGDGWLVRETLRAMENVSLMMATAQLGITLCTLGLGALAKPAVADILKSLLGPLGESVAAPVSFAVALALVAGLHVVLGEMVPKNTALARPSLLALALALPLRLCSVLLFPFVWTLNEAANGILRICGIEPRGEIASAFTRDEVAGLVEESRREGKLDDHESTLVVSALRFEEKTVRSVMLPLGQWIAVSERVSPKEIQALVARHGYSRFPVLVNEEVQGYIHAKDSLAETDPGAPFPRASWRSLPRLEEGETLRSALEGMQRYDAHLARVMRGEEVLGLVALEDLLEELVGEIRDVARSRVRVR